MTFSSFPAGWGISATSGKVLKNDAEDFCCQAAWKSRWNAWLPFKALPRRLAAKRPATYFRFLPDVALVANTLGAVNGY